MISASVGYICTIPLIYEHFVAHLLALMHYNLTHGIDATFSRSIHGSQAHARNEMVNKLETDWLLMIDTDMQFEADMFEKLYNIAVANNIEVLSGIYYQRQAPHPPIVYHLKDDQFFSWDPFQFPESLVPTDATGAGCLLVKKTVFDRIKDELKEEPFSIIPPNSEDFSFFRRLKKLGIQPWVTKEVMCGHYTVGAVTKAMFDKAHSEKS